MSKLFNHTVQPLGSTKSPVEDLAIEVAEAFDSLGEVLDTSTSTIVSITDSIGNPLFQDITQHKVIKSLVETHTILEDVSSIVLENEPEKEDITVSYKDSETLNLINLTSIDSNVDFTNNNQFKIKGKVLELNVRVPKGSSLTISVNYRTETFGLNDTKFLSNVVKKENNSFLIQPQLVLDTIFSLEYETNLLDNLDMYVIDSSKKLNFFYTIDGTVFSKLEVDSYTIKESSIEIITESLDLTSDPLILTYIENTSISELLNALYYEFKNHDHSSHNITKNVDTKDLVNRFINNNLISYKSGDVVNYQFPQYFNREGYNENLDSIYENSILGTVFLSRLISDSVQKYKGLDEDSNKIIFGDPELGPSLNYSSEDESLILQSVQDLNGLSIQVNSDSNYNLKLNESYLSSNSTDGLKIKPENNIFSLVSEDVSVPYIFKFDHSESKGMSSLDNIESKSISINNIQIKEDTLDNSILIDYKDLDLSLKETTKLKVIPELIAKKITVETLNSTSIVSFNSMELDKLIFNPVTFTKTALGLLVENSDPTNEDIKITYNVPTVTKKASVESLDSIDAEFKRLKIGKISLEEGAEELNKTNLYVTSLDDTSTVNFISDVSLNNAAIELATLKKTITDFIGVGEIDLVKNSDNDLEITSSTGTSKVIFKSPVEFLDVTSNSDSKINLDMLLSKFLKIGKHSFEAKEDGSLVIYPNEDSPDSLLHIKSRLKVDRLNPAVIEGIETVAFIQEITSESISVGNTNITKDSDNNMIFLKKEGKEDSKLILKTDTLAHKLDVLDLNVDSFNANALNIGGMRGVKDSNGNLVFNSVDSSTVKKVIFPGETDLNIANISNLKTTLVTSDNTIAKEIQIGNVSLKKDPLSESLVILKKDPAVESELKLKIPTIIDELRVKNLAGILQASFEALELHKFFIKKEVNTENLELVNANLESIFKIKTRFEASNLIAKIFSANQFNLRLNDKIIVGEFNYLTSKNNTFEFVLDKALNFVGSSRSSGFSFSFDSGLEPVLHQYVAANSGGVAIDAEKNVFIELDATNGMYFIKPTKNQIIKEGISYGFNDSTATKNISDLRQWFRGDIGVGNIDGNSLNLAVGDGLRRNGITIGDTRISVIGPGGDCPDGLTTFESEDSIHFVTPLAENQDGCKNLTYQEINTAGINISGELSVDGNASITDSVLVNGTVATGSLAVTDYAELSDTNLTGTLTVAGEASFASAITFKNSMTLNNDLISKGNIESKTLEVKGNASINRDLKVLGEVSIEKDLKIDGSLTVQQGLSVKGLLKTDIINTTDFRSETLSLLGDAIVAGTTILQGKVEIKSSSQVQGNLDVTNALSVRESITADNIFTLKDATIAGTLRAKNAVEFEGKSISIGSDESVVQLNGRLQFNTQDVTFNSPVKIFNTVRITDDTEIAGTLTNKSGIKAESYIQAKGIISTESTLETKSNILARTGLIQQNLEVVGSILTNSVTAESIAVRGSASVANLTISKSLSMPVDTSIIAGDVKFAAITQTNSAVSNNFAGSLSVSKKVEFLGDLEVGQNLIFNEGTVSLNSNGLKGLEAKVDVATVLVNEIKGKERVQPPADLASSRAPGAASLSNTISQRNFVRMDHIISEGISIFNQPLVASTIYYRDLVYVGDESGALGSVNILARQALYA